MRTFDNRSGRISGELLLFSLGLAIAIALIGLSFTAVGLTEQTARRSSYPRLAADPQAASDANGQFAIDLYRRLAETEPEQNLFISPFSISLALTMAAEGAVDQTRDQMLAVLHIPKDRLEQIHRGQRELQSVAVPPVPAEFTEKVAALRAKSQAADDRAQSLSGAELERDPIASYESRRKLREEIKALVDRVSACELQMANALWLEKSYPIEPSFLSTLAPYYGMAVFPVDFKGAAEPARLQINQWIADQTNHRIQGLLAPGSIDDLMRLVITNTVYFKGDWAQPFPDYETRLQPFQQSNGDSVKTMMMWQENWKTACYGAFTATGDLFPTPREVRFDMKDSDPSLYPDAKGHTMLALDYKAHKIQMIFLVPQSPSGISNLEKSLSYETLQRWIGQLELRTSVVLIPKFKFESKLHLPKTLRSLGMLRPFTNPMDDSQGAQFDKMTTTQRSEDRVYISDVVHQTFVEVNEIGTEAAAATAVAGPIGEDSDAVPKTRPFNPIFIADKPFIFLIRDRETASILFLGRYVSPQP